MESLTTLIAEHFIVFLLTSCIIIALGLRSMTTIATTLCREKSRREIAAYIAEGSIRPEQGERLLRADLSQGPAVP